MDSKEKVAEADNGVVLGTWDVVAVIVYLVAIIGVSALVRFFFLRHGSAGNQT